MSILDTFTKDVSSGIKIDDLFKDITLPKKIVSLSDILLLKGGFTKCATDVLVIDSFLMLSDYESTVKRVIDIMKEEISRSVGAMFTRRNSSVTEFISSVPEIEFSNSITKSTTVVLKSCVVLCVTKESKYCSKFTYGKLRRYGEFEPLTGDLLKVTASEEWDDPISVYSRI